jgi:hypothetical protein
MVGQDPVPAADAKDGALQAVAGATGAALGAGATGDVDLTHDPLPQEGSIGGPVDDADELVAQNASESGVAAYNLEIGVADAGQEGADPHFSGWGLGGGIVG